MATITAKGSLFDTNTGNHTVTATPAVGDFIVIVCANSGITAAPTVTDNNADGLGAYTQVVTANKDTNTDAVFIFVRNAAVGNASSTIFTVTGASSTGGGLTVYAIAGALAYGTAGVKQVASAANQSAASVPTVTMPTYNMGLNPVITAVFNDTNPGGVTTPTGYTRNYDLGYATPTTGLDTASLAYTTAPATKTLAWGGNSASNYAVVAIEIYISVMSKNTTTADWSVAGTWDYGVPADNQTVLVDAPSTVSFNVDQSGFANGMAGLTINGTLNHTATSGTYTLKMKAAAIINGTGTWNMGSTTFAAKHAIGGGAAWYISGANALTVNVLGAEPAHPWVSLTAPTAISATRLYVDVDLTTDIWAIGDSIRVANVNKGYDIETATISNITSTYIDISVGLTKTKITGAVVALHTRNTAITVGTTNNTFNNFTGVGQLNISGGMFIYSATSSLFSSTTGFIAVISGGSFANYGLTSTNAGGGAIISISGGNFLGMNSFIYQSSSNFGTVTMSGGLMAGMGNNIFSNMRVNISGGYIYGNFGTGYNTVFSAIPNNNIVTISGGTFFGNNGIFGGGDIIITGGTFTGNTAVCAHCDNVVVLGGTFSNNTQAFYFCNVKITGATFSGNTYDLNQCVGSLFGQTLVSSPDVYNYGNLTQESYLESINAGGSGGAFKSWTAGGITTSVASPAPTGYSRSYQVAPASATIPGWWKKQILVPAGKTVTITTYLYKTATMTYLPRAWVYLDGNQPLDNAGAILHTFTMTDSTTTWESNAYVYTNSGDYDQLVDVMFVAKNASGYVNTQVKADFGGGGVSARGIITGGKL